MLINDALHERARRRVKREMEPSAGIVDNQIVKTTGAGEGGTSVGEKGHRPQAAYPG